MLNLELCHQINGVTNAKLLQMMYTCFCFVDIGVFQSEKKMGALYNG